jgi:hypothetical protein
MKLPILPVASVVFLAVSVAAQASILQFLPKDTFVAITAPDLNMSIQDFRQMPLAKMWAEEEVQAFFADAREALMKQLEQGMGQAKQMHADGQLPFNPEDVLKLRVHSGTLAITKLHMMKGEFRPSPDLGFVLHLDFGDSTPTWNKLMQTGLGMLQQQAGDNMVKKETKIGDITMMSMQSSDANDGPMGLNVAMLPSGVVIGTLGDEVSNVVAGLQSKTPALGAAAHFQSTAKHLMANGAECEVFMRPQPAIDFGVELLRMGVEEGDLEGVDVAGVQRAIAAMGLNDMGAMGSTSTYEGGKCVSRSFVGNGKVGAVTAASAKPIDTAFLKWVPKDAVSFSSGTVDAMSIYNAVRRGLEAYDPEFAKQALSQLAEAEKQMGFTIQNDLFGSLGDHYIMWSMPMGSIASAPEVAFLMKVTDETKIVNVLKGIARMSDGKIELEEGEKRGVKSYQIRLNIEMEADLPMNPLDLFQPVFAFKDGYMVAGFSTSDIKRVFTRMDRADDPKGDIRSNKEFAALQASIPAGVHSLSFTDWKTNFESYYQIATGLLSMVPVPDEMPIDMQLLPESGTLTKHLFGSISWSKSDALGTESVSTGPFGPELMLLFGGLVVGGAGMAASMRRGF